MASSPVGCFRREDLLAVANDAVAASGRLRPERAGVRNLVRRPLLVLMPLRALFGGGFRMDVAGVVMFTALLFAISIVPGAGCCGNEGVLNPALVLLHRGVLRADTGAAAVRTPMPPRPLVPPPTFGVLPKLSRRPLLILLLLLILDSGSCSTKDTVPSSCACRCSKAPVVRMD